MNRSFEYDAVSDDYARFLVDEMLPHVAKTHGLTLSTDPNDRAIAGNSSGAIAAFAAAWQRPDAFRRVFSAIGTYVGPARRQRLPGADPQDGAEADPRLPAGRLERPEQLHRQLVHRQPGHAVGARVRRLRRQPRVGRRRAQLPARDGDLSRRAALAVARLAGADQGQPRGQVAPGRLPDADPRRGVAARERGPPRHRRAGGERQGRAVLQRAGQQPHPQGRPRRQGHRLRREHERRQRHDVRSRRTALCRRHAQPADRRLRRRGQDRVDRRRRRSSTISRST